MSKIKINGIEFDYYEHLSFRDDDWGFGQINIETIEHMVEAIKLLDLKMTLTLVKKITAFDDEIYKYRTIKADDNYYFVLAEHNMDDLSKFWDKVKYLEDIDD